MRDVHAGIRPVFLTSSEAPATVARPLDSFREGEPMLPAKTLVQREKELQSLLATPAGRKELGELESRYREASGRLRPASTSIITYILVHEREAGLIGI
jgi:hypothetical protein